MTAVTNERPQVDELVALYDAVGWSAYTRDPGVLVSAIAGSHRVLTVRDPSGMLLGLVRTVSDGSTICYLQDILVHPDAQRRGVGRALIGAVLDEYASLRQFVLLTDDDEAQRAFYGAAGLVRSDIAGLHAYVRP